MNKSIFVFFILIALIYIVYKIYHPFSSSHMVFRPYQLHNYICNPYIICKQDFPKTKYYNDLNVKLIKQPNCQIITKVCEFINNYYGNEFIVDKDTITNIHNKHDSYIAYYIDNLFKKNIVSMITYRPISLI